MSLFTYPEEEHNSRVMCGDPVALAYEWLKQYAEEVNNDAGDEGEVTLEDLLEAADSHQGDGWGDYIVRGGAFEGYSLNPMFWDKYAIFKGIDRSEISEAHFFSCSC
ncbi:hypothetical protein Axy13_016 [Achromobacter phage vB_AxyP_19-32_Axy13]|uniref:Uncharacterized protein n=1 Tax=Achromobacter phage vB_AxyP_19-32_Axy13 TaxID=2591044 RepID=A0A514CUQ5_9CAUD|nr:hypothetical protein Axy13_016 [Achromobacter phage vB_AxyP_19-32_Axy13]